MCIVPVIVVVHVIVVLAVVVDVAAAVFAFVTFLTIQRRENVQIIVSYQGLLDRWPFSVKIRLIYYMLTVMFA